MRRKLSLPAREALNPANICISLFLILPLMAVVLGSIQSEKSLIAETTSLVPEEITMASFRLILSGGKDTGKIFDQAQYLPAAIKRFPQAFLNSTIVAFSVTFLTLLFGTGSAYAVARLRFRLARGFMYSNLASRMVPIITLMVPLYVTLRNLKLLNSLGGIIVTEVGFLLPYAIWILAVYFPSLRAELEDAARIDGCSRFGAMVRFTLPLTTPGLAACGVILFIISWHELVSPLIVASKPAVMTIPVILASLVSEYFVFYTLMMAISFLGLAPTVLLVIVLRRYVVQGLIAGALKG
jgi:multiple sugar transport system permease protein